MRIESVELKNFRQYKDIIFQFGQLQGKQDLHVILGNNGVGKTNILNAITWCLYNDEFHLGDKNNAKERLNSQFVKDCREKSINFGECSVTVSINSEEDNRKIKFTRIAKFRINDDSVIGTSDDFKVLVSQPTGNWDIYESKEDTQSFVSKYLPESICEYIFFDGEHLEHYFKNSENIENGINELTQAALLLKAAEAYEKYIKTEIEPCLSNGSDAAISDCQKDIDAKKKDIEGQEKSITEIEKSIKECEEKIAECNALIKGHEDVKNKADELDELEQSIDKQNTKLNEKKKEIMGFVRDNYVLFSFYPILKQYYDFIQSEEKAGNLPPKIDKSLLDKCINEQKCSICGSSLNEDAIVKVLELVKKLNMATDTSAELNKTLSAIRGFFNEMEKFKPKRDFLMNELQDIEKVIKIATDKANNTRKYLQDIPNNETISAAITNKIIWNEKKDTQRENIGREKALLEEQKEKLAQLEEKLNKLLEKNSKYKELEHKKEYCKKCSLLLREVRKEILEESRLEMQESTFEKFQKLMWKKDMFTKVDIISDYTLRLIDRYGDQALGSCSAAERALLALSFTLALQETSKHDSLLFIDTPIGRVDPENRTNFMNVLLDVAKDKQVILTFTPSEYDDNVQSILNGNLNSFSKLTSIDGITKIN